MKRLGVLLGTVVVLLAGCGGGGSSSTVDTSPLSEAQVNAGLERAEAREEAAEQKRWEAASRKAAKEAAAEEVEEVEEVERGAQEEEAEDNPGAVSKEEFGDEWPLTVSSGELECEGSAGVGSVVFTAPDGARYGLNGTAQDQLGLPPIDPIWRYDPELKEYGLKVNIGPLLDRGLALCE